MFNLQKIDLVTSIISQIAVIIAMSSLFVTIFQNRRSNEIAAKDRFLVCTSKYMKIQEIMLSNDKFDELNKNIYGERLIGAGLSSELFQSHELSLAAMMFQLMEDVWVMHDLDKNKSADLYSGWDNLFRDWMTTDEISRYWKTLKFHFSRPFISYVETTYPRVANRVGD